MMYSVLNILFIEGVILFRARCTFHMAVSMCTLQIVYQYCYYSIENILLEALINNAKVYNGCHDT